MIVYASRLHLACPDPRAAIQDALGRWLLAKTSDSAIPDLLSTQGRHDLGSGNFLDVATFEGADVSASAFRYGHPDRVVDAREWHTEVGVLVSSGAAYCTVLLQVHDASARVQVKTETTRPLIVQRIVQGCKLGRSTPGGAVRELTEADAEAFEYGVYDRNRSYPIVQISPRREGGYLVSPQRLSDLLTGIAEVAVIPADADTFALSDALGSRFSAYDGAINILWPVVDRNDQRFVPSSRLLAGDIEDILVQGRRPEGDILALICHETNPALARQHLSPEKMQSMALRAALEAARLAGQSSANKDLELLYKQVDQDQRAEISALEEAVQYLERSLTAEQTEGQSKAATINSLKAQLARAGASQATPTGLTPEARATVERGMAESVTMEDCLRVIEMLYPERAVILDSAWVSARKAKEFGAPRDAFTLLSRLCTGYYDAMAEGKGDRAGLEVFGKKSFAARESESVEKNKRARELRSFVYKGRGIEMMRHLKIGVKDSVDKTFRAHFYWDSEAKRVVLGHCGRHLDHT